jgi:hypothetical protein
MTGYHRSILECWHPATELRPRRRFRATIHRHLARPFRWSAAAVPLAAWYCTNVVSGRKARQYAIPAADWPAATKFRRDVRRPVLRLERRRMHRNGCNVRILRPRATPAGLSLDYDLPLARLAVRRRSSASMNGWMSPSSTRVGSPTSMLFRRSFTRGSSRT